MSINILLVEDEHDIRRLLKLHLTKEGFNIIEAENGEVALEKFFQNDIQLVLLDIMLPKIDGIEVLEHIREKSEVPIILITAMNTDDDKVLGLGLGADDYVVKPFSITEVVSRVKAQLRRYLTFANIKNSNVISNGDLSIDIDQHIFKKNGVIVDLLPKEFKIVALLMKNLDRVFTKKQLYEAVWEEEYYSDNNTIMVHFSNLRDKIEDTPKEPSYIHTIRGIGYRMVNHD